MGSAKVMVRQATSLRRCFLCNAVLLVSKGPLAHLAAAATTRNLGTMASEPARVCAQCSFELRGIASQGFIALRSGKVGKDSLAPCAKAVFNSA